MFKININDKTVYSIEQTSLEELKLQERQDLQQWIRKNSDILSRHYEYDLKIISEELDEFEVNDRLDLLAIDETGALVIIELKRKESGSRIDIQGLKYASYCSTLSQNSIVEIYKKYLEKNNIDLDPVEDIISFIGSGNSDTDDLAKLNHTQRIILVSQNFDSRVKSVVAYLSQKQLDISCVEFKVFREMSSESVFIDTQKILPPEDINGYFIKGISESDRNERKSSKMIDQPPEVLRFFDQLKAEMNEFHGRYARGMPHVKYRTFKAGKSGLQFAFEIMKKDKRYKINLISKKPELKMIDRFNEIRDSIPQIKDCEYELISSEEGKSDWERIIIFVNPTDYLNDATEACSTLKSFMDAMEPICERIRAAA